MLVNINNKTYSGFITELDENQIFVFGSNTQGRHMKGTANIAREKHGAIYGKSYGLQGRSYAIVTKNLKKDHHPSVSKETIMDQIQDLYIFAEENEHLQFLVAYHGDKVNLNGYSNMEMASMFGSFRIPDNIFFEEKFKKLMKQ